MNHLKSGSVIKDLKKLSSPAKAQVSSWFFKTAKGQYGYGDTFIGVTVPEQRLIARTYHDLPLPELDRLIKSKVHEHRLTALLILVSQFTKADEKTRRSLVQFHLSHTKWINNWDLVDSSARYILGEYLADKTDRKILYKLVMSQNIWERRIAIVATHAFIARGDLADTFELSKKLLNDAHDLIHKAVGWMLREAGKKSETSLREFLSENAHVMPRTSLRYAIEKFAPEERKEILQLSRFVRK